MKRFQVYKKKQNGGLMHITSIIANSLQEAIEIANEKKTSAGGRCYYVAGIIKNTGEDISRNFPCHISRRIENKGKRTKFNGSLYKYIRK